MNDRVSIDIDNHVAHVRLTRADKMNALDPDMFAAILDAGRVLYDLPGLRCVVLAGEGRSFCAGLDMASMASGGASASSGMGSLTDRTHGNANTFQQVAMLWRKFTLASAGRGS